MTAYLVACPFDHKRSYALEMRLNGAQTVPFPSRLDIHPQDRNRNRGRQRLSPLQAVSGGVGCGRPSIALTASSLISPDRLIGTLKAAGPIVGPTPAQGSTISPALLRTFSLHTVVLGKDSLCWASNSIVLWQPFQALFSSRNHEMPPIRTRECGRYCMFGFSSAFTVVSGSFFRPVTPCAMCSGCSFRSRRR